MLQEMVEMNTLKAWSDDEDESSSEVLNEGEDKVDDVDEGEELDEHDDVGASGVPPGDGEVHRVTNPGWLCTGAYPG